jgi:hypothetical protein
MIARQFARDRMSGPGSAAALLAVANLMTPVGAWAEGVGFAVETGAEYTTGDYGGDQTVEELYIPVTATLDLDRVAFRLTIPFLSVKAPELSLIDGPDGQPIVGDGPMTTSSGIGDVLVAVTVYDVLVSQGGELALDLTGKIKFGTADADDGLGTGEQDYVVQADWFGFFSRFTAMGTAGYSFRGDPAGYDLRDTFHVSLGGSYPMRDRLTCGAFFDYRESSVPASDAAQELTGWMSTVVGSRARADIYLIAGFGDSSPDWGAGFSFRTMF